MTTPFLFSLEVLPADEGDCLLLHWGDDKRIGLIDGGPSKVYAQTLRSRLLALRQYFGSGTLPLSFVMVSHVDNDHILGVKKLIGDVREGVVKNTPKDQRPIKIMRLWHNTFTDILGDRFDSYYGGASAAALAAHDPAADPAVIEAALADAGLDGTADALELAIVLAGHAEGRAIRDDHKLLYAAQEIQRLNAPFARSGGPTPIMQTNPSLDTPVDGLQIRVIGPSEKELVRLRKDFDKYLIEKNLAAPAALAAAIQQDNSATNLSSIVLLAEFGEKKILLTGDALGEKILAGLKDAGQLDNGRFEVDILKVPHHGSARNTMPPFFATIHARFYVFSANGRHGNPDRQSIEWLIASREREDDYRMVFTYPVNEIDEIRRELQTRDGIPWDADRDSIEALLAQRKREGHAFTWTEGRAVLDLGAVPMNW